MKEKYFNSVTYNVLLLLLLLKFVGVFAVAVYEETCSRFYASFAIIKTATVDSCARLVAGTQCKFSVILMMVCADIVDPWQST